MPPPPRPHPDQQAPSVLARVAPLVSRWVERLLAEHDPPLTLAQYLALERFGAGQVHAAELAEGAGVSRSAVSQLVTSLHGLGLVERAGGGEDRRQQPLQLTREGKRVLRSSRRRLRERLEPVLSELPPHQANELARALDRVEELLSGTAPPRRRRPPAPRRPHR